MKINIEVVKVAQVVESWRSVPNNRYTNALADDGDRVRVGVAMIQSLIDVALHAPQITLPSASFSPHILPPSSSVAPIDVLHPFIWQAAALTPTALHHAAPPTGAGSPIIPRLSLSGEAHSRHA